jgi:hypothetical protein
MAFLAGPRGATIGRFLDAGFLDAGFLDAGFLDAGFLDTGFLDTSFLEARRLGFLGSPSRSATRSRPGLRRITDEHREEYMDMATMTGIRIQSVSLGKGHVAWNVQFPSMSRRRRGVQKQYARLQEACAAVKAHCSREECAPEAIELIEKHVPDGDWGSGPA